MLCRLAKSTFFAVLVSVAFAASAHAGKYHAYACRTPSGAVAPADGWTGSVGGSFDDYALNTCAEGGSLTAALGETTIHGNGDEATWTFAVPSGETMTAATLWRASHAHWNTGEPNVYVAWISGPTEPKVFDECLASRCTSQGETGKPLSSANRVAVPSVNLGAHLYSNVDCFVPNSGTCSNGFGDPSGYVVAEYLYASDIVLEQTGIPTAGAPSGPLATETPIHGTSDLVFTASDPASGVYQAIFNVDGKVVQETVINENEGRCRNVGGTTDGLPAFLYVQPCPKSVSADVGLNTTTLTNGHHHVIVSVTDAAGNSAFVLDREVEVFNASPPEFVWKVGSSTLTSGATKGVTAKAAPEGLVLKGKVASTAIKLESTKLKLTSGATIAGGKPGTIKGALELESLKVANLAKCEVKESKLVSKPLVGEIVESAEETKKVKTNTEKDEIVLAPKEGIVLGEAELIGSECTLKGDRVILEGALLAETLPQKATSETVRLSFPKAAKQLYKTSTGSYGKAEPEINEKQATIEGEIELTLTTKESFGAF